MKLSRMWDKITSFFFNLDKKEILKKKLRKFIKKEWKMDIPFSEEDKLISLAERIAMESENSSKEDVYKKWIVSDKLHLPGWIAIYISDEFIGFQNANSNMTIGEMIEKSLNLDTSE